MSISVGSIARTPSIVFRRIGKRQKNAMSATFWTSPIEWSRTIEIGRSAGGGIARQYSTCGIANARVQRESPSGMPRPTPRIVAIPNPSRIRLRLGTTCVPKSAKSHRSLNSTRMVESLGKFGSSACTVQSCHATRIAIGTAISAPILSALYLRRAHWVDTRCEGCQRRIRRSSADSAKWIPMPRKPTASASAYTSS